MTQTSPKPAPQNATNSHGQNPINGLVKSQAPTTNHPLEANSPPQQAVQDAKEIKPPEIEGVQKAERQGILPARWRGLSLRVKATTLAIALSTLPVLAIGATAYYFSNREIFTQIKQQKQEIATEIADKVNRFMVARYGDINILSNLRAFSDPRFNKTVSRQDKEAQLNNFANVYSFYDSIAVFDLNGNVIAKSKGDLGKNSEGQLTNNIKDRDHFQAVIKTDRNFISQPSVSKTTGKVSIFFAAPIKDTVTGKTIAVVRTRMPVKSIDEIIKNFGTNGNEYHVVDSSGKLFVASEKDILGKPAQADLPLFSQLKATNKLDTRLGFDQSGNVKRLLAYTPLEKIAGLPDLNWDVILTTDTAIAFAPQRQLLLTLALGTALTTVLVSAIAAYLVNRATRPILAAAYTVEKLGQGELDTRVAVAGKDELAMLGSNINLMADQLQNRERALLQNQEAQAEQARFFTNIAFFGVRDSKDLEGVFNKALKGARKILHADRVVIYRFNSDWSGYIAAEAVVPGWPQALGNKIEDPCIPEHVREAYKKGRVVPTNNVFEAGFHPEHLNLMKRLQIKANLVTPIVKDDQLFGLLIVHHCNSPHAWQQFEINFLSQLASQLGSILNRVAFLEQQKTAKEQLQKRALELMMEVDPISKGDLTIRASVTEDEIGTVADSYNATVGSLRKIVTQVQTTAKLVATTTSTSEASVQELSTEALRQTEEIAAALDRIQEMSTSIRAVATSAEQAEAVVQQAAQTVEEGDAAMNRTVDGILAIRETVAQTSKKVKRLGESSQKISKVVNLIGNFADQTNLLALNAAIEAAHAGEQGRGFAVVADKVRTLARQSAQATAEIESLVKDIQTETNEVVAAMEAGTEQVVTGTKLVDETRQSLNKIAATSAQISALVSAIASATVTQSQASESVTQTISDVAAISSKTSNEAIVVSASFKELLALATELQASAGQFKVS